MAEASSEADQSDDEGPLASDHVADTATEEEQAAEGQGVGGDDPLAIGVGEVQIVLSRGEGDVDDGAVENDHQLGDPQHGEDPPSPVVSWPHRPAIRPRPVCSIVINVVIGCSVSLGDFPPTSPWFRNPRAPSSVHAVLLPDDTLAGHVLITRTVASARINGTDGGPPAARRVIPAKVTISQAPEDCSLDQHASVRCRSTTRRLPRVARSQRDGFAPPVPQDPPRISSLSRGGRR